MGKEGGGGAGGAREEGRGGVSEREGREREGGRQERSETE